MKSFRSPIFTAPENDMAAGTRRLLLQAQQERGLQMEGRGAVGRSGRRRQQWRQVAGGRRQRRRERQEHQNERFDSPDRLRLRRWTAGGV